VVTIPRNALGKQQIPHCLPARLRHATTPRVAIVFAPGPNLAVLSRHSSSRSVLMLLTGVVSLARAADPEPYRVELASTGDGAVDSTLKATSQLQALRASAPVVPFGLIARARGDIDRLTTVLQSFGYYQGSVSITINGLALDEPRLGDVLIALPRGNDALCRVSFNLGPLYHLGSIQIDGSVPDSARGSLGLTPGAPAVAADVLAGGARLLTTLENQGYAFAKVDPPVAR